MFGVNEVGIRWKDKAVIRGGLTDMTNSCLYKSHGGVSLNEVENACREKSAEVIVVRWSVTSHEGPNLKLNDSN